MLSLDTINSLFVCFFTGLKLFSDKQYTSVVEKSFHVSHAVLDPLTESEGLVEVHALLHSTDYIVCLFDRTHGVIQQPLNLEISEGEELTVYIKSSGNACVHLTGFLIEEPIDTQWEGLPDDGFSLNDVEEDFEEVYVSHAFMIINTT